MPNTIHIPTPLRPFTDKKESVEVNGKTVGELLADLTALEIGGDEVKLAHRYLAWIYVEKGENVEAVKQYIETQADHHRIVTFQEEFRTFLRRHDLEFEERYLWD